MALSELQHNAYVDVRRWLLHRDGLRKNDLYLRTAGYAHARANSIEEIALPNKWREFQKAYRDRPSDGQEVPVRQRFIIGKTALLAATEAHSMAIWDDINIELAKRRYPANTSKYKLGEVQETRKRVISKLDGYIDEIKNGDRLLPGTDQLLSPLDLVLTTDHKKDRTLLTSQDMLGTIVALSLVAITHDTQNGQEPLLPEPASLAVPWLSPRVLAMQEILVSPPDPSTTLE